MFDFSFLSSFYDFPKLGYHYGWDLIQTRADSACVDFVVA